MQIIYISEYLLGALETINLYIQINTLGTYM